MMLPVLAMAVLILALDVPMNAASEACCKCSDPGWQKSVQAVCMSPKEMREHVSHFEPLRPSGLGTRLNIAGVVVLEIRFGPEGAVVCATAKSGHPIAISAAMESVRKWTFKPAVVQGVPKSGCGRVKIRYRLRDKGSESELQ